MSMLSQASDAHAAVSCTQSDLLLSHTAECGVLGAIPVGEHDIADCLVPVAARTFLTL